MIADAWKKQLYEFAAEASIVATLWVCLYELNGWLFTRFEVSQHVNWIFLPAALRMLSVMVFDWSAVAGLFMGAMITNAPILGVNVTHSLIGSTLTGLGPMAATLATAKMLGTRERFEGIRPSQLYLFAVVGSLMNVTTHCTWFALEGQDEAWSEHFVPMFAGDMIGTTVMLYAASFALKLAQKR